MQIERPPTRWLACITLSLIVLATPTHSAEKEAEDVATALKEAKISCDKDADGEITSVTFGSQQQGPINVANLKLVAKLKSVKSIGSSLSYDHVSTEELAVIATIKSLQTLSFDCCQFNGSDLKKLSALPNLTKINWTDSTIGDDGAKGLSMVKTLTVVKLDGNQLSDMGVKSLTTLKELTELSLSKTLDDLSLNRSPPITDASTNFIKNLKQLKSLNLSGNPITDVGLKNLSTMKTLEELKLAGTKVSPAGIEKLQKALPDCKVNTSR